MGIDLALTNVDALCTHIWKTLSQDATCTSECFPYRNTISTTWPQKPKHGIPFLEGPAWCAASLKTKNHIAKWQLIMVSLAKRNAAW
jgi:hypothetical protein